ncbi:tyrosine-type recombinase/integrase [Butyricimonas hominis]|uniref:tyrosine-type recombinase/integrase n=1 Tax=Butyricimonas TaxID=574697 RepID=UPI003511611B
MTNQQFNMRLKVLASYAGIDRKLTSHIARHTFATWALSNGISIETLSKMLGHKDIRTTQVYAKVLQLDVSKGYGKLQLTVNGFDCGLSNVERIVCKF